MMKYLITLLGLFIAFGAWADNRLELGNANGGHHCHAQWDRNNADNEHKNSCKVILTQDGDSGAYTGQAKGVWAGYSRALVNAFLPATPVFSINYVTDCQGTPGTIQDDNGNAFTSRDCLTTVTYEGHPGIGSGKVDIHYDILIRNATAAKAAKVMSAVGADEAGESVMFRQGMGYAQ